MSRIGGDALGDVIEEKVVSHSVARENGLNWQWRFPDELPREKRNEFLRAERRQRLLEVWPEMPLADLDGQTPRQAAANPGLRLRVMALILIMDSSALPGSDVKIFDELRQRLGLPVPRAHRSKNRRSRKSAAGAARAVAGRQT